MLYVYMSIVLYLENRAFNSVPLNKKKKIAKFFDRKNFFLEYFQSAAAAN